MQVIHKRQPSTLKHTLPCCADVGVTGGVSEELGDRRPSLVVVAQGSLCSCTLASLEKHSYLTKIKQNYRCLPF